MSYLRQGLGAVQLKKSALDKSGQKAVSAPALAKGVSPTAKAIKLAPGVTRSKTPVGNPPKKGSKWIYRNGFGYWQPPRPDKGDCADAAKRPLLEAQIKMGLKPASAACPSWVWQQPSQFGQIAGCWRPSSPSPKHHWVSSDPAMPCKGNYVQDTPEDRAVKVAKTQAQIASGLLKVTQTKTAEGEKKLANFAQECMESGVPPELAAGCADMRLRGASLEETLAQVQAQMMATMPPPAARSPWLLYAGIAGGLALVFFALDKGKGKDTPP